jgi:DUF4097 and DUF4098 domain-containing protein YvlB
MNTKVGRKIIGCTGLALAVASGPAAADRDYYEKLDAAPDGVVEIGNVAGDIEIRGTDASEVEVVGRLGDDVEEVIFERDGDVIVLRVEVRSNGGGWRNGWGGDGSADLEIRVPRMSDVRVEAVSSDVVVSDVDGRLDVESVSGDIEISSGATAIDVTTMSGEVSFEGNGQTADASLASVSGDVVASGLGGELHMSSVSGEVELELGEITRLRAQSTSGDLSARATLAPGARVQMETVSGSAELSIEGDRAGDYSLSTFSGDLDNCFGPEAERRRFSPGRSVKFREGDGDRDIHLSSMSGSIRVCD